MAPRRFCTLALSLGLLHGCVDYADDAEPLSLIDSARTSAWIDASVGGTIMTPMGDVLVVPPGALAQSTEITLTPLSLPAHPELDLVGGVKLEPEGLVFSTPATLSIALAIPLPADTELQLAESFSEDLKQFGESGALFAVGGSGTTATGLIWGLSAKAVMKTCHAGTRDEIFAEWRARGEFDEDCLLQTTGLSKSALNTCDLFEDPLQKLVGPYFDVCVEHAAGQPFSAADHELVKSMLQAGRQIVFLFGNPLEHEQTSMRIGGVAHSAVAKLLSDGSVTLRNQLNITSPETLEQLEHSGKSTTVDVPLLEIDVPVLGIRDKHKSEMYKELLGLPFDRQTQPQKVWAHVAVLCEKSRAELPTCSDDQTDQVAAVIVVESQTITFTPDKVYGVLADVMGASTLTDLPGFEAYNGDPSTSPVVMTLATNAMRISGPGSHALETSTTFFEGISPAWLAVGLSSFTDVDGAPVTFECMSGTGTLQLTEYGTRVGDRLGGSFDCTLVGERSIDDAGGTEVLTGTISGTFGVEIRVE